MKVGLSRENDREAIRRGQDVKKWVLPLGFVHTKPEVTLSSMIVFIPYQESTYRRNAGWLLFSPNDEMGCFAVLCCSPFVSSFNSIIRVPFFCSMTHRTTLVAVILNYAGLYCESSWSPGWGYAYVSSTSRSVTSSFVNFVSTQRLRSSFPFRSR